MIHFVFWKRPDTAELRGHTQSRYGRFIVLREVLYYFALKIGSKCCFSRAVAVKFCYFRFIWELTCQPKELTRKLFRELTIRLIMAKAGCKLTRRKAKKMPYYAFF